MNTIENSDKLADRRSRVLAVVIRLLATGGLSQVTTDSVARIASVSKSTIYRDWASREEMVIAAIAENAAIVDIPDMGSLTAELECLLFDRLERILRPGHIRVVSALLSITSEDESQEGQKEKISESWMKALRLIIQRSADRGEIRADLPSADIATMVSAPLLYRLVMENGEPDERLARTVVAVIVNGLKFQD